jgi:predicted nucleotidyltransferase
MLLDPLDAILGTRTKVRLLRALVPIDRPVSGREATRLAGVSHYGIGSLDDLAALGIVRRDEGAGQHLYTFNRQHSLAPAVLALFDAERDRTARMFDRLASIVDRAGGVVAAAVFGSAARGEATPQSDLDLIVVAAEEEEVRDIGDALEEALPAFEAEFGERVSPVLVTLERFRRQHRDADPFIQDVLRDARRICGRFLDEVLHG